MKTGCKNLTIIYCLLGVFSTQSMAKSMNININSEELQIFANKIKMLSSKDLNESISVKKPKKHIHHITTKDITTKEVKSKIKKQTPINVNVHTFCHTLG